MALQLGALRDALIEAGASPAKADKAAEEAAGYENRLAAIGAKVDRVQASVQAALAESKANLAETKADILRWMVGTIGLQTVVILGAVLALARFAHS